MIRDLFFHPDRFFRKRDDLSVLLPALVLFLAGLASFLSTLVLLLAVPGDGGGMGTGPFVVLSTLFNAPIAFGWVLFQWLIYAVAFHALSSMLDGDGSLGETLKVTAWGFVPAVIAGLLNPVVRYLAYGSDSGVVTIGFLRGFRDVVSGYPVLLLTAVGIFFTLWQALIWTFGMRRTHRLSLRRALVVVGIPVTISVLLTLGSGVVSTTGTV